MHEILEAPSLREDLSERLRRLEIRVAAVFQQTLPSAASAHAVAHVYQDHLAGRFGAAVAVGTSDMLLKYLADAAETQTPEFWATPLGRAIGFWTGGVERREGDKLLGVPQVEAAALLGMTRQGVGDAVKRGRLAQVGPGLGLGAVSVSDYMHQRYPVEVAA